MVPLIGFAPDADETTPGVITSCVNMVPTLNGMEGAPSLQTPNGVPVLGAACQGAAVVSKLDNTRRIFAGTQAAIYELVSGTWTDRSKSGGYTGGVESRWSIAQFGDATLMANRADTIQRSTSGAFADIPGAPKAEVVFSVGAFVMALNTNDGAEKPDGWHCCAIYDDTNWTPSSTTQANKGRLVSTPGELTAGLRLGEYAVAYKERSIYLGQYVGAPVVWDWIQVSGCDAGCVGKDALCDVDGVHFFVGPDNFWLFDGTLPTSLGDGVVREWFKENASAEYLYKTICSFDRERRLVWVFYPSKGSTTCDAAIVYNVQTKRFGLATVAVEAALNYVTPSVTIDGLTSYAATIDSLPSIPFDSQYWAAGGRAISVFNASHQLQSFAGDSVSSSFRTGAVGDDDAVSLLQQVRLRFRVAPTTASCQMEHAANLGAGFTNGPSGALNDGKFDLLKSARWHRANFSFTGPVHVTHMAAKSKVVGSR